MTQIFYIDLFSGAGGTTTGIHMVGTGVKVVACVNHDSNAIESHKANHPDCLHFIEDVRNRQVMVALGKLVRQLRKDYPGCIIALWASLECTNYSKAKGGLPRDADSRTLAHALYMYLEELDPDYIDIENVREFMSWGPLNENGRPISKLNGRDYIRWIKKMKSYGYNYDRQLLNSADFGAYTSRVRYFGQFAKPGLLISWPEPTHSKKPKTTGLFEALKKWKPVREVLDLNDEGTSIFTRKKPLSENTLKRIYAGLVKFVANGHDEFIQKYFSGHPGSKVISVNGPAHTVTAKDHHCPVFIKRYNGGNPAEKVSSINTVIGTISTNNRHALVKPCFLSHYYGNGFNTSINTPCPTLRTKDSAYLVDYQYKNNSRSLDKPAPTLVTKDKFAIVQPKFLDQQFGNSNPHSLEQPSGTITTNPKQNLISTNFLFNPGWGGHSYSIEKPSPVIVARQDKAPVSVVQTIPTSLFAIPFFDHENETMKKIRLFMAIHYIIDIKMRMLKIPELLRIQGFPANYILKGTQTEQKKYIGNAVIPLVAKAIIESRVNYLKEIKKEAV